VVLEFKTKKEGILQKKIKRFEELKVKNFSDTMDKKEEIEFDKLEEWLKIHNNTYKVAN
jgi:hypothetical protein